MPLDVARLRRELESFGSALAAEEYENLVGLKEDVHTAPIYDRYAHLSSRSLLEDLRGLPTPADPREARRLRFLESDVLGGVVGAEFAEEEDRLQSLVTRETVELEGEAIAYRSLSTRMREEPDRSRRRGMKLAADGVKRKFLPEDERLDEAGRRFVEEELGYPDEAARWERLHGVSLAAADGMMQRFLRETEALYVEALDERLRRVLGVPLAQAEGHDVAHLMRATSFDPHFPRGGAVEAQRRMLSGLGFRLEKLPNVTLDLEDRDRKDPRAFVMPVRVPSDVRLVTRPRGGVDDYRSLYHESGHALHYGLTRADLPYEDRYHGDVGVTESYAFLFEHLLEDPAHLVGVAPTLEGASLADYMGFCGLDKLMGLRSYGAALHYDLFRARRPRDPAREPARYVEIMTGALKFPANPLDYLSTDGFYGVGYLRAWMFEATHREWLVGRFSPRWWTSPAAGRHLAEWFARGESSTCEELAGELGRAGLETGALLRDVRRLLAGG